MEILVIILIIIIVLAFFTWILPGILIWKSATKKGFKSNTIWPWMGWLFGLFGVLIYLVANPEPLICPQCKNEIKPDWKSCPNCGFSLDKNIYCPNCKKEIPKESIYCSYCRTKLR